MGKQLEGMRSRGFGWSCWFSAGKRRIFHCWMMEGPVTQGEDPGKRAGMDGGRPGQPEDTWNQEPSLFKTTNHFPVESLTTPPNPQRAHILCKMPDTFLRFSSRFSRPWINYFTIFFPHWQKRLRKKFLSLYTHIYTPTYLYQSHTHLCIYFKQGLLKKKRNLWEIYRYAVGEKTAYKACCYTLTHTEIF